jgi:hypothetical protein
MLGKVIIRHLYVSTIHKAHHVRPVARHGVTLQSIVVWARFRVWLVKFFDSASRVLVSFKNLAAWQTLTIRMRLFL